MRPDRTDLALVALNVAALALGAAWGMLQLLPEAPPVRVVPQADVRLSRLPDIRTDQVERAPLFAPSRAAPAQAAASSVPVSAARPTPVLRGVVSANGVPGAVLEEAGGTRRKLVVVGQEFGGWTVSEVGARSVRLRNGATVTELSLRPAASASAPVAKPPPSASP